MARGAVEFTGDFAELNAYSARLAKLPNAHRIIAKNLAEETIDLIREGFEHSKDPYGKPWSYPIFRDGRPLQDTGGLKSSWKRRYNTRLFSVSSTKVYARYLQEGTGLYGPKRKRITPTSKKALFIAARRIPMKGMFFSSVRGIRPRKMVPKDGYLPRRWRLRYIETANDVIAGLLKAA
jgi:phage gpG-like protein